MIGQPKGAIISGNGHFPESTIVDCNSKDSWKSICIGLCILNVHWCVQKVYNKNKKRDDGIS